MSEKASAISVRNVSITYKWIKAYSIKKNLLRLKKADNQIVEAMKVRLTFMDIPYLYWRSA